MGNYVIRRKFKDFTGYYYGPVTDLEENKTGHRWALNINDAKVFNSRIEAEYEIMREAVMTSENQSIQIIKAY